MPAPIPVSKDFNAYRSANPVEKHSRVSLASMAVVGMLVIVISSAVVLLIRQYAG